MSIDLDHQIMKLAESLGLEVMPKATSNREALLWEVCKDNKLLLSTRMSKNQMLRTLQFCKLYIESGTSGGKQSAY